MACAIFTVLVLSLTSSLCGAPLTNIPITPEQIILPALGTSDSILHYCGRAADILLHHSLQQEFCAADQIVTGSTLFAERAELLVSIVAPRAQRLKPCRLRRSKSQSSFLLPHGADQQHQLQRTFENHQKSAIPPSVPVRRGPLGGSCLVPSAILEPSSEPSLVRSEC